VQEEKIGEFKVNVTYKERSHFKKKFQMNYYNKTNYIFRDLDNQLQKINLIKNMCNINCGSSILDVGCGIGLGLLAFPEPSCNLIGIDLSHTQIKIGRTIIQKKLINTIHFIIVDADNLPFLQGFFDLVYCISLLHHVTNPEVTLNEMIRVAKYKGKLAVSEQNIFNLYSLLCTLKNYKLEHGSLTISPYIKKFFNKLPISEVRKYNLIITPKLISKKFSSLLRRIGDIMQNTPLNYFLSIVNIYTARVEKH